MSDEQRKAWTASLLSAVHTSSQTAACADEGGEWVLIDPEPSGAAATLEASAYDEKDRTQVTFSLKDDGGEQAIESRQDGHDHRPLTTQALPALTTASCAAVGHHRKTVTFEDDGAEQATEPQQEQATKPQQEERDDRPPPKQKYFRRTTALHVALDDYHKAFEHLLEPDVSRGLQSLRIQWYNLGRSFSGQQFVSLADGWRPEYGLECLSVTPKESRYLMKTLKSLEVVVATRHGDSYSRLAWTVSLDVEREKIEGISPLDVIPDKPSIHGRPLWRPQKAVPSTYSPFRRSLRSDSADEAHPTVREGGLERAAADQQDSSPLGRPKDTEAVLTDLGEILVGLASMSGGPGPPIRVSRRHRSLLDEVDFFVRGVEMTCCLAASSTMDDTTEIYLVPTNRPQEFQWHLTVHSKTGKTLQARREDLTC